MTPLAAPVVIIGGGISGLATAFYLRKAGIASTIVEASGKLGGLVGTNRILGCQLEAGPDSFLSTKTSVARLAEELGIADQLIGSNDEARRVFVVRDRKLVEMPRGMVMMAPSEWGPLLASPLLSGDSKLKFLEEYFYQPKSRAGDFSIRDLVLDHYGEEALAYITEPLLAGVYGGEAARLSARSVLPRFVEYETNFGSLTKGVRENKTNSPQAPANAKGLFWSFRDGMGTLVEALAEAVRDSTTVRFARAKGIRQNELSWQIELEDTSIEASGVVLACPAHQAAKLLSGTAPTLSDRLSEIPYSSSLLVTLIFERKSFDHPLNGFGFLVPAPERRMVAAATWINTKFPLRIAPELIAIRAFLVDPEAQTHMLKTDEELGADVLQDLQSLMGFTSSPVYREVQRWPHSMPQYVVGHAERIASVQTEVAGLPGLGLSGNYLDGVGVPDSVRSAELAALKLAQIKNHSSS